MNERNGEYFYTTADIDMDRVHQAMTDAGRRTEPLPLERLGHDGWRASRGG